jgi:hypothetical protein
MEQRGKRKAAEDSDLDAPEAKRVMLAPTETPFGGLRFSASPDRKTNSTDDDGRSEGERTFHNTDNADVDMPDAVDPIIDLATLLPTPGSFVPASSRGKSIFPFLYLPTEIRFKIYGYLFKSNKPIFPLVQNLPAAVEGRISSGFPPGVIRAMACVNKRLSKEVLHFIYSRNRFRLTLNYHRDWLNQIGRENASTLQELIVVGDGRVHQADEKLAAMLSTIWKRADQGLRFLTVHDQWFSLNNDFVVRRLLEFGERRCWKRFGKLEVINIDIPHRDAPQEADKALYEKLCFKSHARVTLRHKVSRLTMAFHPVRNGWFTVGQQWFCITYDEVVKRVELTRENKKQIALWEKKRKRMELVEQRAKARSEAWLAKCQEQSGQSEQNPSQQCQQQGNNTSV